MAAQMGVSSPLCHTLDSTVLGASSQDRTGELNHNRQYM